ncbi:MAG: NUDIX domain-containing protein [Bacteriovoracaceae bacterium]|nr:NUDIX domain-containing protein [Bacteriovoracaceae bacterium]
MQIDIKKLKKELPQDFFSSDYLEISRQISKVDDVTREWRGATLALLIEDSICFIKRSELVPSHRGQIAFFGGNKKSSENDPIEVIKREFTEETNFSADNLEILGLVPPVYTSADSIIVPVVAKTQMSIRSLLEKIESNGEWDDVFTLSFKDLSQEDLWFKGYRVGEYSSGALLYRPIFAGSYVAKKNSNETHLLWGATARMVWNMLRIYYKDN